MENKNSYLTRSIYAIYDKKARRILSCIDDFNADTAKRNFINALETDGSLYHANPEDFQLLYLGMYNIVDCQITDNTMSVVYDGVDFIKGCACDE